jgi:hypothetical protein
VPLPPCTAADIQAGDGAVRQELADRAHRRLIGGAQRFIDGRYPPEMIAHGHVRHLPHTGPLGTIIRPPCPVHLLFTRDRPAALTGAARRTRDAMRARSP